MYIESLFFFDFWINFLILFGVSIIVKKEVKIFNLILGSFVGSVSVVILFLEILEIQRMILKIYFSILMVLLTFRYDNFKSVFFRLITFYFLNFILGGFFYFLKLENVYDSFLFLFILSPLIIYIYIRQAKKIRRRETNYYKINIHIGQEQLNLVGFLDSGNTLMYKNNLVIVTNLKNDFKRKKIFIPYNTIGNYGLLECIKVDKVLVNKKVYNDVLLGFSDKFEIEGANVLLHTKMEG